MKKGGEFVDFSVELYPWWIFLSSHVSFQGGGVGFCPFFGGRKGVSTVYLEVKRLVNSPSLMGCFRFVVAVKTYQFLVALETFKSLKLAVGVLYTSDVSRFGPPNITLYWGDLLSLGKKTKHTALSGISHSFLLIQNSRPQ